MIINMMSLTDNIVIFFKILLCFFIITSSNSQSIENQEKFIVVIDAGHGGKDPGNTGNGYLEKEIVLSISLQLGEILEKVDDIEIIYTRTSDKFVNLFERANIANKSNANLFISIHADSHNSQAYGAGTFVLGLHANQRNFEIAKKENSVIFYEDDYVNQYEGFDPNNPESLIGLTLMQEEYLDQSIVAASYIQNSFVQNLKRKNRNVKQAGFIVLKYTYMPSVLVETGFLTNKSEGKYLNSKKGQKEMSNSIADAIIKYKNNISNTSVELSSDYIVENDVVNTFLKIQIASGSKFLPLKSYNFKGLSQLSYSKRDKNYKYYFENTNNYEKAKEYLLKAKRVGFKDAIIVAFNNGKRISIDDFFTINSN